MEIFDPKSEIPVPASGNFGRVITPDAPHRNGILCGTTDMPHHTDTGLGPGTTYHYHVRAYDTRHNYSAWSNTATAVTETGGADTIPPVTIHDYQHDGRWVNTPAEIRLTAADEGGSGVKATWVQNGLARVDLDGSGAPAGEEGLNDLGFTEDELRKLAELYPAGRSLWRVGIAHFSPVDLNWPYGPPAWAHGGQ